MADNPITMGRSARQMALDGMAMFADRNDVVSRDWQEIDEGSFVRFVGVTAGGREFSMGYAKPGAVE